MNQKLLGALIKGTAKALPKIVEKLGTTQVLIKDITMQEMVDIFRSHPNHPKCAQTTTSLSPEQVLANCKALFAEMKATISTSADTKDNWLVVLADKERPLWGGVGLDSFHGQYMVALAIRADGTTMVIVGYRLAEAGKYDVFGLVKKGTLERVHRLANVIQPNSGLQFFPDLN